GIAKGAEDALASIKVLAAMLLFPLTWVIVAVVVGLRRDVELGVLTLVVAPLLAYAALVFFERLDRIIGGARALGLFAFRRWAFLRLLAERKGIPEHILALGRDIGAAEGYRPVLTCSTKGRARPPKSAGPTVVSCSSFSRRAGGTADAVLQPAEQPIALVGRRVESQCRLDFRQRFLRLALVEQDAAQVETALDVGRVLLDRLPKRAHGLVAVARLPGREAE